LAEVGVAELRRQERRRVVQRQESVLERELLAAVRVPAVQPLAVRFVPALPLVPVGLVGPADRSSPEEWL
jgi:hypothetical protein